MPIETSRSLSAQRGESKGPIASLLGMLLFGASAACYGSTPITARLAYDGGTTPPTVLTCRFVFAASALALLLPLLGRGFVLARPQRYAGLVTGALMATMSYGFLAAITYLPVSVAVLVFFSYPVFVVVVTPLLGFGRVGWIKGTAALAALFGLALGIGLESGVALDPRGLALAVLSAAACGTLLLYSGRAGRGVDGLVLAFHSFLVAGALFLPLSLLTGDFVLPHGTTGWVALVGNVGAFFLGVVLFFLGVGRIDAVRGAALANIEPIVSILGAVVVLGEVLAPTQLIGIFIVLAAVATMTR
jgi:drug/metabolite transporter (DMT)-like permease